MPIHKRGMKSRLEQLPTRQREKLIRLLLNGLTYKDARPLVANEFGVVTSEAALSKFYSRFAAPRLEPKNKTDVVLDVVLRRRKDNSLQLTIFNRAPGVAIHAHKNLKALVKEQS